MPEKKNLLLIFTRNRDLGKVKKRLAAKVGDLAALGVYEFLLKHTATITAPVDADKRVYYSERVEESDLWNNIVFEKRQQKGSDLGERMMNAFKSGFESGYSNIIIIGSDLFDLSARDLAKAFAALETSEYVIGPAMDGGYYLLGMKSLNPAVFRNKAWSTDSVLEQTLENIKNHKITILEERNDIDHYEDIEGNPVFQQFLK